MFKVQVFGVEVEVNEYQGEEFPGSLELYEHYNSEAAMIALAYPLPNVPVGPLMMVEHSTIEDLIDDAYDKCGRNWIFASVLEVLIRQAKT